MNGEGENRTLTSGIPSSSKGSGTNHQIKDEGQKQETLWALEKWKSKIRIPTFHPARIACGVRKRTAVYTKLLTRPLAIQPGGCPAIDAEKAKESSQRADIVLETCSI